MINILDISNEEDKQRLKEFSLLEHPTTFRYFKNRVFEEAIQTHVVTLMYSTYGYAHIDRDMKTNRCYLGVCVLPDHQHKGIGTKLIETLLKLYTGDVYLTVDKENTRAIALYRRFGFVELEETDAYSLYKRTSPLQLEVSIGEAVDKLTILDIKLEKIKNPLKQNDCNKERNAIMERIESFMNADVKRFYTWLKYINKEIWEIQDELREQDTLISQSQPIRRVIELGNIGFQVKKVQPLPIKVSKYSNEKFQKILDLNDMRFRVKKRINALFETSFQEQKGYSERVGIFLGHLGMGDLINLNGAIRYSGLMVDKLYVISMKKYVTNIREMFQDDPSIIILECRDDVSDTREIVENKIISETITHRFFSGHWDGKTVNRNIPFDFYDHLKINHDVRKIFAHFPSYYTLTPPNDPFVFVHSMSSNTTKMPFQITWNIDETLTIDPGRNFYSLGHKWFDVAESYINKPIFSYIKLIEKADQIHVTDSSFYCLCCFLNLQATIKNCYDRLSGNVSTQYIFN